MHILVHDLKLNTFKKKPGHSKFINLISHFQQRNEKSGAMNQIHKNEVVFCQSLKL